MSTITAFKEEPSKTAKKGGGRPQSEGWAIYSFEKVDGDKGKCLAKCMKCLNVLQNTSLVRMANHRKKCGLLVPAVIASPPKNTTYTRVEEQEQEQQIVWETAPSETAQFEFIEETIPHNIQNYQVEKQEKVSQTAMEIINDDIKRHRKSKNKFGSVESSLSTFLIGCGLNFEIVDSSHFKKFVNTLNSTWVVPSSSQLKARILSKLADESPSTSRKRKRYETSSESD